MDTPQLPAFADLGLDASLLRGLAELGYEAPSDLQARVVPALVAGRDVLCQAQAGSGKTAAYALALLSGLDLARLAPQALVVVPNRAAALRAAEGLQRLARPLAGLVVAPVYGGQHATTRQRALARGAHVVVGTPAELAEQVAAEALSLADVRLVVLDEVDEVLRDRGQESVEALLAAAHAERAVAIFSATLPDAVRLFARMHLREPEELRVQLSTAAVDGVRQSYQVLDTPRKLEGLTQQLEEQGPGGLVVCVRRSVTARELAESLAARGLALATLTAASTDEEVAAAAAALGAGELDLVLASDRAARRLALRDARRVVHYDLPTDTESYVRSLSLVRDAQGGGEALLFVTYRERGMLRLIEFATNARLEQLPPLGRDGGKGELRPVRADRGDRPDRGPRSFEPRREERSFDRGAKPRKGEQAPDEGMERFRIEVGFRHGVKPGHIVGAIANEADLTGKDIGKIEIYDTFTTVDLPAGMPAEVFETLKRTRVCERELNLSKDTGERPPREQGGDRGGRPFQRGGGGRSFGGQRDDRGGRSFGGQRDDRGGRSFGGGRDDRGGRSFGGDRDDRGKRSYGGDRDDRGGRSFGGNRDDRGGRSFGGGRDDRGGRPFQRGGGGRSFGGGRDDRGGRGGYGGGDSYRD